MDTLRRVILKFRRIVERSAFFVIDIAVTLFSKNLARTTKNLKNIFQTKIYDCITFSDGLEVLEIRLNVLDPYVDYFVIVEATKSHSGKSKPLYFKENSHRYAKFKEKIIHVVVENMPALSESISRYDLTSYQRNQIKQGLTSCRDSDIIIVSDMDEIPNPKKIAVMVVLLNMFWKSLSFRQRFYYYYLNGVATPPNWDNGTVACKYSTLRKDYQLKADRLRPSWITPERAAIPLIMKGGWHFSYLGGADRIINKIGSIEVAWLDKEEYKDRKKVLEKIEQGKDIFDREDRKVTYIKIDDSYPEYILSNISKYKDLIKDTEE